MRSSYDGVVAERDGGFIPGFMSVRGVRRDKAVLSSV
jgi:hypothetical protein